MTAGDKRPRRWGSRALLLSLALHGLLVLVLRLAPRRIEPPAPQPLEIELQETPPAPQPLAVGPPAPVAPPAPPRPATPPERRPRPSAGKDVAVTPAPPVETAPEAPSAPSLLRMRPPKLTLDDATVDRFSREGVISSVPLPEAAPAGRGKSKWQEKLAMLERDTEGRKNVIAGKVHPQVFDFMRDAQKIFSPRESVVEKDPRAPNTVGRSMKSWTKGFFSNYLDQLRKLELEEPTRKGRMAEGGTDLMAEYNRLLRAAEKGGQAIACQVCLVVRPGLPPEVVLASSSGNKEVDTAAVDALNRAALRRPYEKDLKPERACYRFAATVYRIPPLPIAGCGFDEVKLKIGCYYPGMQVYKLNVTLDLVDYSGG